MNLKQRLKERILWMPHNIIAHPLMAVLPTRMGNIIHNATIPTMAKKKELPR